MIHSTGTAWPQSLSAPNAAGPANYRWHRSVAIEPPIKLRHFRAKDTISEILLRLGTI